MIRNVFTAASIGTACILAALALFSASSSLNAIDAIDAGRFVWHDLMTKDVAAAKRFYGGLLGWQFENTKRGDRPYVLARLGADPVAGIVDVSSLPDAAPQWISFMAVPDVEKTVSLVRFGGGKVLAEPREVASIARAAVVSDPQGAPLGVAQLHREIRGVVDPTQPVASRFFWQEYLADDAAKALMQDLASSITCCERRCVRERDSFNFQNQATCCRRGCRMCSSKIRPVSLRE
jgi:predicted enzyme related to lactoylglutathione lyase